MRKSPEHRLRAFCRREAGAGFARLICPSGQYAAAISAFQNTQITLYPTPSRLTKGRFAIVTDAGRDAVDADAPLTNGA